MLGCWLGLLTCWGTWVHTSDLQWVRSTRARPHGTEPALRLEQRWGPVPWTWTHSATVLSAITWLRQSPAPGPQPGRVCVCVCVCVRVCVYVSLSLPAACSSLLSCRHTGHLASASALPGVLLLDSCHPVNQSFVWRTCHLMFCAFLSPPRCCSPVSLRLFLHPPPKVPYPEVLLSTPAPCPPWAAAESPRRSHSTALASRFLDVIASPLPSFSSAPTSKLLPLTSPATHWPVFRAPPAPSVQEVSCSVFSCAARSPAFPCPLLSCPHPGTSAWLSTTCPACWRVDRALLPLRSCRWVAFASGRELAGAWPPSPSPGPLAFPLHRLF